MEKNTVLSPKDVLASIYDAEPADLQLAITLNPDVERIAQAMEIYAQQFQSPAPLSAAEGLRPFGDVSREEIEKAAMEFARSWKRNLSAPEVSAFMGGFKECADWLLSQRQPVAPEREDAADALNGAFERFWGRYKVNNPTSKYSYKDCKAAWQAASKCKTLPLKEVLEMLKGCHDIALNTPNPCSLDLARLSEMINTLHAASPSAENKGGEGYLHTSQGDKDTSNFV